MHHMNYRKTHCEKARQEQHKNGACYLEQVLEATLHKITAVGSLATHLKNDPSKTNKAYGLANQKRQSYISECVVF